MLEAGELRRRSRGHAEDEASERLDQKFLRAVGEHGNENEDRETAGRGLAPDFRERATERGAAAGRRGVGARWRRSFEAPASRPQVAGRRDGEGDRSDRGP